jgi:phosphatidylserine/phosphatidylglycerophosphate/cardiolipin synthase-like enzyme
VVPVRGKPKRLEHDDRTAVSVEIRTEPEQAGAHAVYFNRGVAASQAYARKIPDPRPDPDNPGSPQMRWLSRGLYEALTEFIGQARGSRYGLRGAFYEFRYLPVAQALKRAARAGADVKILYDAVTYGRENRETIGACGITRHCRAREGSRGEKHNKFLVLLRDGKPVSVWTGSTNLSVGGIFGHSNVGHVVRDRRIAEEYLAYWNTLWEHPDIASAELRRINSARTPTPVRSAPANSTLALFSPRDLPPLDWYAQRMDAARRLVCFTAASTIHPRLASILGKENDVLRYVLKDKAAASDQDILRNKDLVLAVGSRFEKGEFPGWLGEKLTGFNRNLYIHDKFLLLDPLGDDPLVITGSANFSQASTTENDENMLVIRGNTRVADIYFGEFMRLFDHIYARYLSKRAQSRDPRERAKDFLKPNDSWVEPHFTDGPKARRRRYFHGPWKP